MSLNKAIFVTEEGNIVIRSDLPPIRPEPGELLIEVFYSGVNPSDVKSTQVLHNYGNVQGVDFSGRVLEAPADSPFLATPPDSGIFKVPSHMPLEDATAFMVAVQTASDGLFNRIALPGGGTSIGFTAIQLARAAGVPTIITTASPSRHQMLKDLGATHCFDYRNLDVKTAVRRAIDEAGNADFRGFETAATADTYRLFVDTLTALPKEPLMCFCWVMTDERRQSETVLGGRHYDVVLLGGAQSNSAGTVA